MVLKASPHRFCHGGCRIGRRYREEVVEGRNALFSHYLDRWTAVEKWKVKDGQNAANTFVGLLRANLFEEALHGLHNFDQSAISAQARLAAAKMLILLKAGQL